jgi:hypothetical protein
MPQFTQSQKMSYSGSMTGNRPRFRPPPRMRGLIGGATDARTKAVYEGLLDVLTRRGRAGCSGNAQAASGCRFKAERDRRAAAGGAAARSTPREPRSTWGLNAAAPPTAGLAATAATAACLTARSILGLR